MSAQKWREEQLPPKRQNHEHIERKYKRNLPRLTEEELKIYKAEAEAPYERLIIGEKITTPYGEITSERILAAHRDKNVKLEKRELNALFMLLLSFKDIYPSPTGFSTTLRCGRRYGSDIREILKKHKVRAPRQIEQDDGDYKPHRLGIGCDIETSLGVLSNECICSLATTRLGEKFEFSMSELRILMSFKKTQEWIVTAPFEENIVECLFSPRNIVTQAMRQMRAMVRQIKELNLREN